MLKRENQLPKNTLDSVNPQGFGKLHSFIKPRRKELRWTEIPWEINLWEARQKASQQKQPLFIWAMNGNPLGCT
ncbi:hypothetical protein CMK10_08440 [Candidatus Poribacteria bacterium]|nr:hypothetical protein [Candidatus Poribacteria bacterium]